MTGSELTLFAGSELKTSELDTSELKTSEYRFLKIFILASYEQELCQFNFLLASCQLSSNELLSARLTLQSWQQRIRLYYWGKENGVNILKSIDEGPFQMGTFRETLTEGNEGALHIGLRTDIESIRTCHLKIRKVHVDIRATTSLIQDAPGRMQLNSKFVNNMLPEWGRFIIAVNLNRGAAGYVGAQNRVGNANPYVYVDAALPIGCLTTVIHRLVPESDLEEDPKEDDDEDLEEDPANYPADGGDNGDDEDESSDDDEDDDVYIEEEEEHPAPAESTAIPSPPLPVSSPVLVISPSPPASPIRPLSYQAAMIRLRAEAPSTSHSLPLPPPIILSHTRSNAPSSRTPPLLPIPLPTSSPPLHLLTIDRRADRPEVTLPPRKRLDITLGLRYEVGESSSAPTARPP
ncbi:hypothetical protein Tco_1064398 [Tanacetum coccineum]